jgi:hypothetical protein
MASASVAGSLAASYPPAVSVVSGGGAGRFRTVAQYAADAASLGTGHAGDLRSGLIERS